MSEDSLPCIGRRDFLRGAGTAAASVLVPSLARSAPDRLTTISIIHTTDLHGHVLPTQTYEGVPDVGGFARCASAIRRWRAENPDHLLIDVGDLYQGTHLSYSNAGRLMMRLQNDFRYDAWVLGNHEFDWGIGVVEDIVDRSAAPVLTANVELHGRKAGGEADADHPFSKIAPWMIREVAGFKIGLIGLLTPGLSYWLPPDLTTGIAALDPAPIARDGARRLREVGADAVVIAGHMGSKFGKDDFANRVDGVLAASVGQIDAYIAGHTHRDLPSMRVQRALYTQAGYHGIYLGRVDLTFDRETRALVDKRAFTVLMDDRFPLDPLVIERARPDIELSERALAEPVGFFAEPIPAAAAPGKPSGVSRLIASAIASALAERDSPVDAVLHGQFLDEDLAAGEQSIADVWRILPYENRVVTASLTAAQLKRVLEQMFATPRSKRNLIGAKVSTRTDGDIVRVTGIAKAGGTPLADGERLRVAFNSYDARSGGQRFMLLRDLLESAESNTHFEPVETRAALIDFLADRKSVSLGDLLV